MADSSVHPFVLTIHEAKAILQAQDVVHDWSNLLRTLDHVNGIYGSPLWLAHLADGGANKAGALLARDHRGSFAGIVPFCRRQSILRFDIAGRLLASKSLRILELLGSIPMLPENFEIHDEALRQIFSAWPECDAIYMDALPADSYFWQFLNDPCRKSDFFYVHVVSGPRPWHLINLAPSYDLYLKSMSSKARANLCREVKRFKEAASGTIQMCRVTARDQVAWFLECAARIAAQSWQRRILGHSLRCDATTLNSFQNLADLGLLRSYLLQLGEAPCSFVIGYQYQSVYHYVEIAFDEGYSQYSPGKVHLSLILEDLHQHAPPKTLNFGVGDAAYKRRFGNCEKRDVSCLLMRPRIRNVLVTKGHSIFTATVAATKRIIGRRVTK
ncbi:MAG: GNAT family N-acetyltransferase [Verrucomicrobia bacterium]|nr:GNAT family N-acetyltransferase [Verrucomicrobiota bacterium]